MTVRAVEGVFEGGPMLPIQKRLGLLGATPDEGWRGPLWVVAIGWVPLLLIVASRSAVLHDGSLAAFLADRGVQCRALISAPALVLAKAVCFPQLTATCGHFLTAGLIPEHCRPRFDAALASTRRLHGSVWATLGTVALAYASVLGLATAEPALPSWHVDRVGALHHHSLAGWWHLLVTAPLLLMLVLGWLWRVLLWTRLLWVVSHCGLELTPTHPDGAGGLRFVGYSVRSFALVGFAVGAIVAGALANELILHPLGWADYRDAAAGVALAVVVVFVTPVLVFFRPLLSSWHRGIHEYGSIANGLGQRFEGRWLGKTVDDAALGAPDFSALADLYQCVSNAYGMKWLPVDLRSVLLLGLATVLPTLVVAALRLPLDAVRQLIASLVF